MMQGPGAVASEKSFPHPFIILTILMYYKSLLSQPAPQSLSAFLSLEDFPPRQSTAQKVMGRGLIKTVSFMVGVKKWGGGGSRGIQEEDCVRKAIQSYSQVYRMQARSILVWPVEKEVL